MVQPGAFVVLSLLLAAHSCASKPLRGLNPELSQLYISGQKFACLDKSLVIPFEQVNDNYCDCADGSDEPDCCDGTDEPPGKCTNKCIEHSAGARDSVRRQLQEYEAALQVKQSYIQQAAGLRETLLSRLQQLGPEIETQTAVVKQLQEEVDRLGPDADKVPDQAPADAQIEEHTATHTQVEAQQHHQEEPQPTATEEVLENTNDRELKSVEPNQDADPADGQGTEPEVHESPEPGYEWHGHEDEHAAYDHDVHEDAHENEGEEGGISRWFSRSIARLFAWLDSWGGVGKNGGSPDATDSRIARSTEDVPGGHALSPAAQLANAKSLLEGLTQEKEELERQATYDYGLQDEFLALRSRCLRSSEVKYTYEACMFGAAHQIEGASKTKLGSWKGFENNYSEALFDNGDYCWNAPNRSLRLTMSCSSTDEVYGVDEPSRCVYTGKMKTPAVCSQAGADAIKAQLAEMERLEEELRKEIAADEEAVKSGQGAYDEL